MGRRSATAPTAPAFASAGNYAGRVRSGSGLFRRPRASSRTITSREVDYHRGPHLSDAGLRVSAELPDQAIRCAECFWGPTHCFER